MSETIRVLLADDDVIVREGLADLLNQQDGIDVVAVAENGSEALREALQTNRGRGLAGRGYAGSRRFGDREGNGEIASLGRCGHAHCVRA